MNSLASKYQYLFWKSWTKYRNKSWLTLKYDLTINNKIDIDNLEQYLRYYIDHINPLCKCIFYEKDSHLYYRINDEHNLNFKYSENKNFYHSNRDIVFDLEKGPLYEFKLCQRKEDKYCLEVSFSHAIFDGTSFPKFLNYLEQNIKGVFTPNQEGNYQSINFQKSFSESSYDVWDEILKKKNFDTNLAFLQKGSVISNKIIERQLLIQGDLKTRVSKFRKKLELTTFEFLSTVLLTLIGKYNQIDEKEVITIGHTVNTNTNKKVQGCFTNLNPLQVSYSNTMTPVDMLLEVKSFREKSRTVQNVPILEILNELNITTSSDKIFNVFINPSPILHLSPSKNIKVRDYTSNTDGDFDLGMVYDKNKEKIVIKFKLLESLGSKFLLEEFSNNFLKLLEFFVSEKGTPLNKFSLSSIKKPLDYQEDKLNGSIHSLILDSFSKNLNNQAVIYNNRKFTYKDILLRISVLLENIEKLYRKDQILESTNEKLKIGILGEDSDL